LSRIGLKEGWISDTIYINVCAFSNDIGNKGGGYMIVGDFEQNGVAKRPVQGFPVADVTSPVACFMEKRGQPIKRTTFALFCQLLCPARGYSFALSIETDNK
jgi:hypothetical protein